MKSTKEASQGPMAFFLHFGYSLGHMHFSRTIPIAAMTSLGVTLLGTFQSLRGERLACPHFPECFDSFLPPYWSIGISLAMFHRWMGIGLMGLLLYLAVECSKQIPGLARFARHAFALSLANGFLGMGLLLSPEQSSILHQMVGWVVTTLLIVLWVRSSQSTPDSRTASSMKGLPIS
jgi:heme A synthase